MQTSESGNPVAPGALVGTGRRRWPWVAGLALGVVIAANHIEYSCRRPSAPPPAGTSVAVRREDGAAVGHNTIGIDEEGVAGVSNTLLRFATLAEWQFDPKAPTACPPTVQKWQGRHVGCVGFMYPLEPGGMIRTFCLLRTTQTCCYGPRPQYNQYLLVEMAAPVKFERLRPVLVRGRFMVDPQPDQGFIYRLEATACIRAADDEPEVDPVSAAREAGLPLFDFGWLAAAAASEGKAIPSALAAAAGRPVVVVGYFLEQAEGPPPSVLIGKEWWDGVGKGVRPTPYTALPAYLRDAAASPPLWQSHGAMTGVLRVEPDPGRWPTAGVVSLHDAVRGVPGRTAGSQRLERGPFLKPWQEAVLAVVFAGVVWRARRSRVRCPSPKTVERSVDHA